VQAPRKKAAAEIAHESERARHAEQVAGGEQRDDSEAAPIRPRQDVGQVERGELGSAESVNDYCDGERK
jgi:hypothetical protein